MTGLQQFLDSQLFGITITQYGLAFLAILVGFALRVIVIAVMRRMMRLSERTKNMYDDIIIDALRKPVGTICLLLGIWVALIILPLPKEPFDFERFMSELMQAASIAVVVWFGIRLSNGFGRYFEGRAREATSSMTGFIPVGRKSINVFLFIIGALLVVQNLGYSITSLLAGVGIGGMAMAFAARDTLANLFGSFVVFVDRPFHVGDWVEIDDIEGTVEELGLRVTRIRTFANSEITMPNSRLTTSAVQNWSRMKKRRIKMTIGVTYDTPPEKLRAGVEKIREIIRDDPKMHHDFFLVNFNSFGAYSLDIFIYCFTVTTKWADFLQARDDFMLEIMREFEKLGIEFAFPTQTLHFDQNLPGDLPKTM